MHETEAIQRRLGEPGLRYISDLFPAADQLTLATNDEYGPVAEFLGEHRVDRNPAHVTYVVDTREGCAKAEAVADHAYWLSGLRVRDAKATGTIDVRSDGFGVGDPEPLGVNTSGGVLEGGSRGPMAYAHRVQEWSPAPAAAKADRLAVKATNVDAATVDARRAGVSCAPQLDVTSDGPLDLRIACPPARSASCARTVTLKLPRVRGRRVTRVTVLRGSRTIKRARGRNLRRVSVRRPTRGAFTLKIRAHAGARTITVVRRFAACR